MKRYFIVADVHGFYNEMITALNKAGFDFHHPDHIFVSLGDMFDRGRQPKEVLNFVLSLPEERTMLVRGNHEILMEQMLQAGAPNRYDKSNGTVQTAKDLTGIDDNTYDAIIHMRTIPEWREYMYRTQYYFQVGKCVFTHGWIPVDWENPYNRMWDDATWTNGMEAWALGAGPSDITVFCGHWHTSWGHCHLHHDGVEFPEDGGKAHFSPFIDKGIVAMDACTVFSHKVNCLAFDEDELNNYPLIIMI